MLTDFLILSLLDSAINLLQGTRYISHCTLNDVTTLSCVTFTAVTFHFHQVTDSVCGRVQIHLSI